MNDIRADNQRECGQLPMHRRVTAQLRHQILNGELAPGTVLPTMHALAKRFGTGYGTVQSALTPMVEEGLLERKRGVGTIVRHNPEVLTRAAIYCGHDVLGEIRFAFGRQLVMQLRLQLSEEGVDVETFVDSRPKVGRREPLATLKHAVETNAVQALLVPQCDQDTLPWLQHLPVASSFAASATIPNRVSTDTAQMLRLGLERLRDAGCQTVGLISTIQHHPLVGSESSEQRFYESFIEQLNACGLSTRDNWMRVPGYWQPQLELHGYSQFKALWEQAERPDGILVYPDIAARGVMSAALESGVRTPDDLHIVFHHNKGIDWTCPLAVDWIENDIAHWASEMIGQVRRQKAGQTVTPVLLPYRLRQGGEPSPTTH